jgi:hypothetical protein
MDFEKYFIIYTNAIEEAVFVILLQCEDQNNKKAVAYMSQSISNDEFRYSSIEKYVFSLVKDVEKFHHFILGKHTGKSLFAYCQVFSFIDLYFMEDFTLSC